MTEKDLKQVYQIECNTFSIPWSLESLSSELNNPLAYYIVVVEQEQVVGYGGLWGILGEGEITNIAVSKEFRGRGIGQRVLTGLLEYAQEKNLHLITLEVRESNQIAQALYIKNGFKPIAIRKNYYQKPTENAVIMQRSQS